MLSWKKKSMLWTKVSKSKSAPYYKRLPSECEINDALKWKQHFSVVAAPGGGTSLGNLKYSNAFYESIICFDC